MKQLIIPLILLVALVVSAILRSEALFFCRWPEWPLISQRKWMIEISGLGE